MRLRRALDEFIVDGVETTLPLFRTLVRNTDIQNGLYDIHWLGGVSEGRAARLRSAQGAVHSTAAPEPGGLRARPVRAPACGWDQARAVDATPYTSRTTTPSTRTGNGQSTRSRA